MLLYRVIRSGGDCVSLQSDLDILQEWEDDWQMRFNALKCQHISFCGKQVQINFNYMICNEVVKQVDSIKYLGVIIDKKITWSQQVDKIALKANRVREFLYRNIKHYSPDIKNRCYKIFIQPILEYALIIWSPYYNKDSESRGQEEAAVRDERVSYLQVAGDERVSYLQVAALKNSQTL